MGNFIVPFHPGMVWCQPFIWWISSVFLGSLNETGDDSSGKTFCWIETGIQILRRWTWRKEHRVFFFFLNFVSRWNDVIAYTTCTSPCLLVEARAAARLECLEESEEKEALLTLVRGVSCWVKVGVTGWRWWDGWHGIQIWCEWFSIWIMKPLTSYHFFLKQRSFLAK